MLYETTSNVREQVEAKEEMGLSHERQVGGRGKRSKVVDESRHPANNGHKLIDAQIKSQALGLSGLIRFTPDKSGSGSLGIHLVDHQILGGLLHSRTRTAFVRKSFMT